MDSSTKRDYISEALAEQAIDLRVAIAIATEGIYADLDKEIGYGPEKSRLYAIRSTFYSFLKNYDAAIEDISKVISICLKYPGDGLDIGEYYAYRASLFQRKGDFQTAIEDYTAAIAADPKNYKHHFYRGLNKLSQVMTKDAAVPDFKQAFALVEKDTPDYRWLEDFFARQDKIE